MIISDGLVIRQLGLRNRFNSDYNCGVGFPGGASGEEPACQCRRHKRCWFNQSLGREDPLKEDMATHSSILAWRIPWTEEPDGPQSRGLQRAGH